MKTKALTLTLVLILILTALAGCTVNTGNTNTATTAPPANSGNTNDPGSPAPEPPADNSGTDGSLTPPAWLIGSWTPEDGASGEDIEVTAKNVTVSSGNLDFSWQIKNVGLEIKESLDGEIYTLSYTAGGADTVYTFAPGENGSMKLTSKLGGLGMESVYRKK